MNCSSDFNLSFGGWRFPLIRALTIPDRELQGDSAEKSLAVDLEPRAGTATESCRSWIVETLETDERNRIWVQTRSTSKSYFALTKRTYKAALLPGLHSHMFAGMSKSESEFDSLARKSLHELTSSA